MYVQKINASKKLEWGKLSNNLFQKEFKKALDDPQATNIYIKYMSTKKSIKLDWSDFP